MDQLPQTESLPDSHSLLSSPTCLGLRFKRNCGRTFQIQSINPRPFPTRERQTETLSVEVIPLISCCETMRKNRSEAIVKPLLKQALIKPFFWKGTSRKSVKDPCDLLLRRCGIMQLSWSLKVSPQKG